MGKITPNDIQQQQFKIKFRGFDIREVDIYLEKLSEAFESLTIENSKLRDKIDRLNLESEGYKKREEIFKRAILNSQKVLEQMKQNAQKSAELIVAEAEVNAEKILNRAHNRLAQLHEDIAELKRQRMQIEVQIRSILESHSKLLDIEKEDAKVSDEADNKVKVFNRS
ncbi:MAG: DivIVA domain-containing protein [Desulfobacteraceae bacterium]|nr:MAG: DivIVA domain-containing protein [Desulfobacteraceae bacterium]